MDRKIALKMENWKELYNSLLQNIQTSSKELSSLFIKKAEVEKELKEVQDRIVNTQEDLVALKEHCQGELSAVRSAHGFLDSRENKIQEREEQLIKDKALLSELTEEKKKELNKIQIQINSENSKLIGIISLQNEADGIRLSKLSEVNNIEKERESKLAEIRKFDVIILEKREENADANTALKIKEDISKDLDKEIEQKQRSMDSFKENKRREEKDIEIKRRDMAKLESRIRRRLAGTHKFGRKGNI